MFVDGVQRVQADFAGSINASAQSLNIGGPTSGNAGGNNYAHMLDEYALYSSVLTPARVLAHYNAGMLLG
jgi:hypothetical protein